MSKTARLIIGIIVLVLLVGAYFAYGYFTKEETPEELPEEEKIQAYYVDKTKISEIKYYYGDNADEEVILKKADDGVWKWKENGDFPIKQTLVDDMVSELAYVEAKMLVTEDLDRKDEYSLGDVFYLHIDVTFADETEVRYTLGAYNSVMQGYYFNVSANQNIYLVGDEFANAFLYFTPFELADTQTLQTVSSKDIIGVNFFNSNGSYAVSLDSEATEENSATFSCVLPDGSTKKCQSIAAGELISAVSEVSAGKCVGFDGLTKFSDAKKVMDITVRYNEETNTGDDVAVTLKTEKSFNYSIIGDGDSYYLQLPENGLMYEVSSSLGERLFNYTDPAVLLEANQ